MNTPNTIPATGGVSDAEFEQFKTVWRNFPGGDLEAVRHALNQLLQSRPSSTQSAGIPPLHSVVGYDKNDTLHNLDVLFTDSTSAGLRVAVSLSAPPATSGMKEAKPTSLWANLRSVKAALTGELGVQVTPYLYAEKVAIDDVEFLIGKQVNQDGLVGDAERKSLNAKVADTLRPFLKPGQKVIWREPFRWHDDNGVLSNHYDGMNITQLAYDFDYEVEWEFCMRHAAIVTPRAAGVTGDAS